MINTYQTSLAAPPVPPRLNRSHPVLIPAPLPSSGHTKPLVRFLVGVAVLNLVLTVGGFIFLYTDKMDKAPKADRTAARTASEDQVMLHQSVLAAMVLARPKAQASTSGHLQWDATHSHLWKINYSRSWLTIQEAGDYFVYSRVTFTRGDLVSPLASRVKLKKKKDASGEGITAMQAYCHAGLPANPQLCTATQVEVMRLEKGDQLSVWVTNPAVVDYDDGATTFGMYKL